jgi:hypothetical protein
VSAEVISQRSGLTRSSALPAFLLECSQGHPFCQEKGCWKWGRTKKYTLNEGDEVTGEEMCPRMAALAPAGPSKYLCAGLFVGRCKLVRKMLNYVDSLIPELSDFVQDGSFDQALYQIMQLRYPELNIRVDSEMKYFQNWHALGAAQAAKEHLKEQKFKTMFGVQEDFICNVTAGWKMSDFQKYFGEEFILVHFNGDAKVPLMNECIRLSGLESVFQSESVKTLGATWINPDTEIVANCFDNTHAYNNNKFLAQVRERLLKLREVMEPAWYAKFPYSFKRGNCVNIDHQFSCPPDETKDKIGKGLAAYFYDPYSEALDAGRGPSA